MSLRSTATKQRIASIDIFRALTMITMLFVNDFAGMGGIPHWLGHAETQEDMMGFSDLVFPAFLFCMGLSIPIAIGSRLKKGANIPQVIWHIGSRFIALLVMGLFSLNCSSVEGGLSRQWFSILMVIGFFLVWNDRKPQSGKGALVLSVLGWGGRLLLFGLFLHRILNGYPVVTSWWGILGLIGWAYLFASAVYLCTRRSFVAIALAWAGLVAVDILNFSGVNILGSIPGGWTHIALAFSGVTVASLMQLLSKKNRGGVFVLCCLAGSAAMLVLALISHPHWIISKNLATPTWMFFSLSASLLFFGVLFYLGDMRGINVLETGLGKVLLKPAGVATITCYMLPTLTYAVRQLLHISYPHALSYGVTGLGKSLVFALVICGVTGLLSRYVGKLKV